jgi:hypothetical protein
MAPLRKRGPSSDPALSLKQPVPVMNNEDLERAVRALDAESRIIATVLSKLPQNSTETMIILDDLVRLAGKDPDLRGVGRDTLYQGLRDMERFGFGQVRIGRRDAKTRLILTRGLTVGRVVRALEPANERTMELLARDVPLASPPRLSAPPAGPEMIPYRFPLREGVKAELLLPADLTAAEVERLTMFLRALSMQ